MNRVCYLFCRIANLIALVKIKKVWLVICGQLVGDTICIAIVKGNVFYVHNFRFALSHTYFFLLFFRRCDTTGAIYKPYPSLEVKVNEHALRFSERVSMI